MDHSSFYKLGLWPFGTGTVCNWEFRFWR